MASLFDLEKLSTLLKDFYELASIRITVFDENLQELISYPQEVAPYCQVIRGSQKGITACMECDRNACAIAAKKRGTYIYQCHAGFTEAVTPLYIGEILAGYLLFGHIFPYESHDLGWQAVEAATSNLFVNHRMLKDAVFEAKYIPEEHVRSASHILRAVSFYLILEKMTTLQEDQLSVKLESYLLNHFTEKIGVDSICAALNIGKSQLYALSHQLYGCPIAHRIRDMRIDLAKELLLSPEAHSLSEISDRCGYTDYNYFIAVFTKMVGSPPRKWKQEHIVPVE